MGKNILKLLCTPCQPCTRKIMLDSRPCLKMPWSHMRRYTPGLHGILWNLKDWNKPWLPYHHRSAFAASLEVSKGPGACFVMDFGPITVTFPSQVSREARITDSRMGRAHGACGGAQSDRALETRNNGQPSKDSERGSGLPFPWRVEERSLSRCYCGALRRMQSGVSGHRYLYRADLVKDLP